MTVLISTSIREFLTKNGRTVPASIVTSQPANLREDYDDYFGNKFGFFILEAPMIDSASALKAVIRRSKAVKRSPEKWIAHWTSKITTYLPGFMQRPLLNIGTSLVNAAITNVRGPPMKLALCENELTRFYGVLNPPPGVCLGFAIFSYDGRIFISAHTDKAFCKDAQELIDGIVLEYEKIKHSAQVGTVA